MDPEASSDCDVAFLVAVFFEHVFLAAVFFFLADAFLSMVVTYTTGSGSPKRL
jgi:hypothetical protein